MEAHLVTRVESENTENFIILIWVKNWDPGSEVAYLFLIVVHIVMAEIPDISCPTIMPSKGVVDLMELIWRVVLNWTSSGPHIWDLLRLDGLHGATEKRIIAILVIVLLLDNVSCEDNKVWLLLV